MSGFRLFQEDRSQATLWFKRGFGWTNPIDLKVWVFSPGSENPHAAVVRYQASILALADPMGFTKGAIDMFEKHVQAHLHSAMTGAPLPPPPKDLRAMKINFIIIGIAAVLVIGVIVAIALVVLLTS